MWWAQVGAFEVRKKRRVDFSWHQLEIMMNGCDWTKVGAWESAECLLYVATSWTSVIVELHHCGRTWCRCGWGWVTSMKWGSGEIRFSQKREKASKNRHHRAACVGMHTSNSVLMHHSKSSVYRVLLAGLYLRHAWDLSWLGPQGSPAIHSVQNHDVNGEGEQSWGDSSPSGTKRSCSTGTWERRRNPTIREMVEVEVGRGVRVKRQNWRYVFHSERKRRRVPGAYAWAWISWTYSWSEEKAVEVARAWTRSDEWAKENYSVRYTH